MRTVFLFSMVLVFAAFAYAGDDCCGSKAEKTGDMKAQACEVAEDVACEAVSVPTAQCGMCEATISKAVKGVKGVSMVKVDAEKNVAHVHFDKSKASLNQVEQAIAKAGYDANDVERNEQAHANLPKCCQVEKDSEG
ncbi:MAG: heavy-metal-associated domain-containing protein [candidate division KSB1 bacterium]|nr:heavy-metal-associated domain-containing protein [candidate division KSB1 bacterium]